MTGPQAPPLLGVLEEGGKAPRTHRQENYTGIGAASRGFRLGPCRLPAGLTGRHAGGT